MSKSVKTAKEILETRYNIAPQMKEYDKIGNIWIPYLMYFHTPNYSSGVVNTDSRGFRVVYKDSKRISDFKGIDGQSVCLFVGGSTAFGVGATDDRNTIPSVLNAITDNTWLNFGGRAFSSTQELLLFMFYHRYIVNTKKIVICSGVNNMILHYLCREYPRDIGLFFFWNQYKQRMNAMPMTLKRKTAILIAQSLFGSSIDYSSLSRKELFGIVLSRAKRRFYRENATHGKEKMCPREDTLHILNHDLMMWKLIF